MAEVSFEAEPVTDVGRTGVSASPDCLWIAGAVESSRTILSMVSTRYTHLAVTCMVWETEEKLKRTAKLQNWCVNAHRARARAEHEWNGAQEIAIRILKTGGQDAHSSGWDPRIV